MDLLWVALPPPPFLLYLSISEIRRSIPALSQATVPMYLKSILTALVELHARRLVHMDIKPANILCAASYIDRRTPFIAASDYS